MEKQKLNRYTGTNEQLFGLRRVQLQDGTADGCSVIEVTTAGGLQADVLINTGMDLGLVRYKGTNIGFLSKNGYDTPARFAANDKTFVNNFPTGLLYTCGLRSTGPPCTDGDEYHPLHGRIHGQPATNVSVSCEDDQLIVQGTLRETSFFGYKLELRRKITFPVWGSKILIEDTIENLTQRPEEFAIIYHINFGYPMLSENARVTFPEGRKTIPRTECEFYLSEIDKVCEFTAPVDEQEELVYFHELDEGWVVLENPDAKISMKLNWDLGTLPVLAQWKSMVAGEYALGLEPTNNYVMGRVAERENGTLKTIEPYSAVKTRVEMEFGTI